MNRMPENEIERAIDEVLATMVEGEPRLVSGASVRRAMGESRRPLLPRWFQAVAAVLVVGVSVALLGRTMVEMAPDVVVRSTVAPPPGVIRPLQSNSPATEETASSDLLSSKRSRSARPDPAFDPPYEGLPRLTVASIDLPEPLFTIRLGADPIQISLLEIAPLSVSSRPNEQEN